MYRGAVKRALDLVLALCASVVLLPLLLVIALLVKLTSKGPVLFRQKRIGRGKTEFFMLKFRSMRTDTPKDMPTHLLENPERYITPVGRILRKTSLDELPQLLNILTGDMSLIGPRPALWNQTDLLRERDRYGANDIRPGLTGLAQIRGRDELPIKRKAAYDGLYARKMSFSLDSFIFIRTVAQVLMQRGVVEGSVPRAEKQEAQTEKEPVEAGKR